jgi:hypothetical protein
MNQSIPSLVRHSLPQRTATGFVRKASSSMLRHSLGGGIVVASWIALHAQIGSRLSGDDREDSLPADPLMR